MDRAEAVARVIAATTVLMSLAIAVLRLYPGEARKRRCLQVMDLPD